jgi:aspartate aminotransferase-like enzyme
MCSNARQRNLRDRIGTIGQLSPPDIEALLQAMRCVLEEMGAEPGVRAVH